MLTVNAFARHRGHRAFVAQRLPFNVSGFASSKRGAAVPTVFMGGTPMPHKSYKAGDGALRYKFVVHA